MKKKILILDDVKAYLDSLERALSLNYDIVKAVNLNEAKEKMGKDISLALVDIRLSEEDFTNRDGILFLSWLKENFPDIPVIMMSAYRDFDSAVESLNLGANYFVKKPISLNELKEKMNELLSGKK